MKKYYLYLGTCCLFFGMLSSRSALASDTINLEDYYSPSVVSVISTRPVHIKEAKDLNLDSHFNTQKDQALLQQYNYHKFRRDMNNAGQSIVNLGLAGFGALAGDVPGISSPAAKVSLTAIPFTLMQMGSDKYFSDLNEEGALAARRTLGNALMSRVQDLNDSKNFPRNVPTVPQLASEKPYTQVLETIITEDPEAATLVTHSLAQYTANGLKNHIEYTNGRFAEFDAIFAGTESGSPQSLVDHLESFGSQAKTLHQMAVNQNDLAKQAQELSKKIDKNSSDIEKNTKDISSIQRVMFGTLDPKSQLAALKDGWETGLTPEEEDIKKAKLEFYTKAIDTQKYVSETVAWAQVGFEAATLAGFKGKAAQNVSKGLNVANGLLNAGSAFLSGNYSGAVMGVLKLFGPSHDIASERHNQILGEFTKLHERLTEEFNTVNKNLSMIDAKMVKGFTAVLDNLSAIQQGQQVISNNLIHSIELQKETISIIQDIDTRVANNFKKLQDKVGEVHMSVHILRLFLAENTLKGLNSCLDFFENRKLNNYYVTHARWESYEELETFVSNNSVLYENCHRELVTIFPGLNTRIQGGSHMALSQFATDSKVSDSQSSVEKFYSKTYKPLVQYLASEEMQTKASTVFAQLLHPSGNALSLKNKTVHNTKQYQDSFNRTLDSKSVIDLLSIPLNPETVMKAAVLALQIQPYEELRDDNGQYRLMSLEKVKTIKRRKSLNSPMIKAVLNALDLAIAQQSLIGGDALIPYLAENLKQNKSPLVLSMLRNNPSLAQNVLTYIMAHGNEFHPAFSSQSYNYAFKDPSFKRKLVNKLVPSFIDLRWKETEEYPNGQWFWFLGDDEMTSHEGAIIKNPSFLPLPGPEILKLGGPLDTSSYLQDLLQIKQMVLEYLDMGNLYKGLPNKVLKDRFLETVVHF